METGLDLIVVLLYLSAIIISIAAIVKYFYLCSDVTNLRKELNDHLFDILEQLEKLTERNKKNEAK